MMINLYDIYQRLDLDKKMILNEYIDSQGWIVVFSVDQAVRAYVRLVIGDIIEHDEFFGLLGFYGRGGFSIPTSEQQKEIVSKAFSIVHGI